MLMRRRRRQGWDWDDIEDFTTTAAHTINLTNRYQMRYISMRCPFPRRHNQHSPISTYNIGKVANIKGATSLLWQIV